MHQSTKRPPKTNRCLQHYIEAQVNHSPHSIAIRYGDESLTYIELNHRANKLAHQLIALGVKPNTLVGIFIERSIEMVIAIIGIIKAGGAYLPIDTTSPHERLQYIFSDSDIKILISQKNLLSDLNVDEISIITLDHLFHDFSKQDVQNPEVHSDPENLAYVIYTSGSTGKPKGVMISHSSICNLLVWTINNLPFDNNQRILQKTPYTFDASVWEIFSPLISGGQLIIAQPNRHQDPACIIKSIKQNEITSIQVVPTFLNMLLNTKGFSSCNTLEHVYCGGELVSKELHKKFKRTLKATFHNFYGPTETCVDSTHWSDIHPYNNEIPIGKPIANTDIYILDDEMNCAANDTAGEIYIAGAGLAKGYLNKPELTAENFISNPFSENKKTKLYKTGDIGKYQTDGNIVFIGRKDYQVKIRGVRIELGEIESNLLQHNEIEAVVVHFLENDSSKKLVAYMISKSQMAPSIFELQTFLRNRIPVYMLPHAYVFLESFPYTSSGKIDRKSLPKPGKVASGTEYVAANNDIEKKMVSIWQEIFKITKIGTNDNFFILGGDSILAAKILLQIEESFSVEISLIDFYKKPTITEIGNHINHKIEQHENKKNIKLMELLDQIENMSDEEIKLQLQK